MCTDVGVCLCFLRQCSLTTWCFCRLQRSVGGQRNQVDGVRNEGRGFIYLAVHNKASWIHATSVYSVMPQQWVKSQTDVYGASSRQHISPYTLTHPHVPFLSQYESSPVVENMHTHIYTHTTLGHRQGREPLFNFQPPCEVCKGCQDWWHAGIITSREDQL